MSLTLTSPAFTNGNEIPAKYTAEDDDVSPALHWANLPAGTQSLALIVEDPDAPDPARPQRIWVHWILVNLPPSIQGLPEAVRSADLPTGTVIGTNDWHIAAWGGPNPPIGRHRYFFRLFALDAKLPFNRPPTKADVERAMAGHVLAQAELMGTYQKRPE